MTMIRTKSSRTHPARSVVRCAVYTRKSTEEGLEQEFNSLDAQREAGEAYIKSQAHDGWELVPSSYDDGGFTGGNMDRPALRRLMADIEAGKIDCVVVYKVDRLSRSLLDFARMMETFEKHRISFVSVTQQFNTAASMGRLILNVLLSFAQFEREMISERTRDKIAAARRKGKWVGGMLKGILRCGPCGCAMTPTHVTRNQTKRYRYYVCSQAQKRGWHTCPSKSIPAAEIEQFVVDQIRSVGRDPELIRETVTQAAEQARSQLTELDTERRSLEREIAKWTSEVRSLVAHVGQGDANSPAVARLADLQERIRVAECRALEIRDQTLALNQSRVDQQELVQAMSIFNPVWDSLTLREQARVVHLLVERVDYDGARGKVAVTFRPGGLPMLATRLSLQEDGR